MSFHRKSPGSGYRRLKSRVWVCLSPYRAVTPRRWQSCDRKDVMWPHVMESDPEVMSFPRKSLGSCCQMLYHECAPASTPVTVCARLGPLWSYSCFQFESANNQLKKLFHGTRDMSEQVLIVCLLLECIYMYNLMLTRGPWLPFHKYWYYEN